MTSCGTQSACQVPRNLLCDPDNGTPTVNLTHMLLLTVWFLTDGHLKKTFNTMENSLKATLHYILFDKMTCGSGVNWTWYIKLIHGQLIKHWMLLWKCPVGTLPSHSASLKYLPYLFILIVRLWRSLSIIFCIIMLQYFVFHSAYTSISFTC